MQTSSKPELKRNHLIVFDGDSLTRRGGMPNVDTWPNLRLMGWSRTWADVFAELAFCWRPDLQLRFSNCAISGSNSRGLASRIDSWVLPKKPDWVIMTIGNNDAPHNIPPAEFRALMTEYVEKVNKIGGKVLFLGGFRPGITPDYPKSKVQFQQKKNRNYKILSDIAKATGNHYLDVGKPLLEKAKQLYRQHESHTVYSDGGHFNEIGATIIAGTVMEYLGLK